MLFNWLNRFLKMKKLFLRPIKTWVDILTVLPEEIWYYGTVRVKYMMYYQPKQL